MSLHVDMLLFVEDRRFLWEFVGTLLERHEANQIGRKCDQEVFAGWR